MREEKVPLFVRIPKELDRELRELIKRLYHPKDFHGALSHEVAEALRNHIIRHTQNHTKILVPPSKINPTPKTWKVYQQVKRYLAEKYKTVLRDGPQKTTTQELCEAVKIVRNVVDPRTLKGWVQRFEKEKCIKWLGGEIWELI